MSDASSKPPHNEPLLTLTERCAELEWLIADGESYLQVAKDFTSDEEKWRTTRDLHDYRRKLTALQQRIASLKDDEKSS
jgi:predicted hydrolase (HD superfamily)